jgi:hypothetical protein
MAKESKTDPTTAPLTRTVLGMSQKLVLNGEQKNVMLSQLMVMQHRKWWTLDHLATRTPFVGMNVIFWVQRPLRSVMHMHDAMIISGSVSSEAATVLRVLAEGRSSVE